MKRLIASLVISLGLVLANVGLVAAVEQWRLEMFDPSTSTTNRTINIEYKVLSVNSDTFDVELFEDGEAKESHENISSDSGIFTVNIPSTGTYTYKITATNDTDNSTATESRTVQVVDGPAPTVTTVFVNNANAAGGAGGQGAGGAAAGEAANGQVAGAAADEGQVSAEAANDQNQEGDVLGASEQDAAKNNRGRNTAIAIVVAVAAAGGAYYWFLARPRKTS